MIREASVQDITFIDNVFRHPEIYPHITDDNCPRSPEGFSVAPIFHNPLFKFIIASGAAVFMLTILNSVTLEIHSLILPEFRGKSAVDICRAGINYMFAKPNCRKLVTQVPVINLAAYALAYKVGMRVEGFNKKSFLKNGVLYDQYFMGISKEVV